MPGACVFDLGRMEWGEMRQDSSALSSQCAPTMQVARALKSDAVPDKLAEQIEGLNNVMAGGYMHTMGWANDFETHQCTPSRTEHNAA